MDNFITEPFSLMGAKFRGKEILETIAFIEMDTVLTAVRDADNPYDPNAIELHHDGVFIGFVAKESAAVIAPYLDRKEELIFSVETPAPEYPLIRVERAN